MREGANEKQKATTAKIRLFRRVKFKQSGVHRRFHNTHARQMKVEDKDDFSFYEFSFLPEVPRVVRVR